MIRSVLVVATVFLAVSAVEAQESQIFCPKIDVIGPSGITQLGDEMVFVAKTKGTGLDVKYEWRVENGKIVKGHGTAAITVVGDQQNTDVRATVRATGFPQGCENTASELGGIAPVPSFCPIIDEWSKIKPNDEKGRLDNFFAQLANSPDNTGVFLLSGVPPAMRTIDHPKVRFIVNHAKFRKFNASRFIFLFETESTEVGDSVYVKVFRLPPGAEIPFPTAVLVQGSLSK